MREGAEAILTTHLTLHLLDHVDHRPEGAAVQLASDLVIVGDDLPALPAAQTLLDPE